MLKTNYIVDLKQFTKVSLMSRDDISQTFLIKEKRTKNLFSAKIFNINSNEFQKKISNELLYELTVICDSLPLLFVKFRGISLTDFDKEQHPVLITENTSDEKLLQIIENAKDSNSRLNWNETKKLINIYGIAYSFFFLNKHQIKNIDLKLENVFETSKYYPRINIFDFTRFESEKIKNIINFTNNQNQLNDTFSFANIVYSIVEKEKMIQEEENLQKSFLNKIQKNKTILKRYKKLIIDCISSQIDFETILDQLKNDQNFITKKVDQKEFYEYVHLLESIEDDKGQMNKKLNIIYLDLNRFEKQDLIAKESLTSIYKIKNKDTEFFYTAKTINGSSFENPDKKINVLGEVIIHSHIKHPSIINFIGFSSSDFKNRLRGVIVTEYMRNGTLGNLLQIERDGNEIPFWNSTMKLINIYGIASAMAYLHSKNIIHRDLKPGNILLDDYLFPHLSNFSLSKALITKNSDENLEMISNIKSMAPEKIIKDKYIKATDVYSFGMIVYQILTKKSPFIGPFHHQININTNNEHITIPEAYEKLIESCCDEFPKKRLTFTEIVDQLKTNTEFITNNVNENIYHSYIEYIDQQIQGKKYNVNKFHKHPLEPIYNDYKKILELKTYISGDYNRINIKEFKKLEIIGQGAFGKVFTIKDEKIGKIYAAKKLSFISNSIDDFKKRIQFSREVSILSLINHPLIIKFIGYSPTNIKDKPKPVIALEYMKNGSLEDLFSIQKDGNEIPFWNDTMKLINIYGIALAMSYLHSKDIIHRDLKPGNILLDDFLFPHLSDFGLSKFLNQKENVELITYILGTYQFIAPEIFDEEQYSKASDVYSFGMIVYQIMTGESPFDGLDEHQFLFKIMFQKIRPSFTNEIPKIYKNLINVCWHQDPSKRPTFAEIVDKLRTNPEFITENVDKKLFESFVAFADQPQDENTDAKKSQLFNKCSLESIKKENDLELKISNTEGFVNINNYEKVGTIQKNDHQQIIEVKEQNTGNKYTAIVSKYIEKFDNTELHKISQEAKQLLELKHSTIQQFIGFSFVDFNHKKRPVILNENCSRRTLFDIFENEKNGESNPDWNDTNKLIIIYGIAYGMNFLHSHKISHPNLNPKNIFIDDSYHPKLGEIGNFVHLQKSKSASSRSSSQIIFTQFYLAPEILESKEITLKSDVYSFAFIVYEIITNGIPFENIKNPAQIYYKIVNESYRPEFNKQIPEIYCKLIEECWLQNPDDRPSFSDIINELENNELFITGKIDKVKYFDYIELVKNQDVDE